MAEQAPEDLSKERCHKLDDELEDTIVAFEGVEQTLKHSITTVYIAVSDSEPNRARALEANRQSVTAKFGIEALCHSVEALTHAAKAETP